METHFIDKFENIKTIKYTIDNSIVNIKNISIKLNEYYHELIKENNSNIFIFGIDSLFFQNKLIENELDNSIKLFDFILNRMYSEHYKLYRMIYNFINETFKDHDKLMNIENDHNFPKYNDLDIYKKYDFSLIINIHKEISNMFSLLQELLNDKIKTLKEHKKKNNIGLNIDNFVNTFHFEVNQIDNQVKLFKNYLSFFNDNHLKNLNRFYSKVDLLYKQINDDLNFSLNDMNDDKSNNNFNDTINNNIDIEQFNNNDSLSINEIFEVNEMFKNDIKID